MNVISMVAWMRPSVYAKTLHRLSQCIGVERYALRVYLDGGAHPEVERLARSVDFCAVNVFRANRHMGCNGNTFRALDDAFKHADYVLHVEEDIALAPDALLYWEWARQFGADPSVFTANVWRHDIGWLPDTGPRDHAQDSQVARIPFFNCWGWATWADRWQEIAPRWTTGTDHTLSWDTRVHEIRGDRHGLQPLISRAVNIGDGGVHRGAALLPYWAGEPGFTPQRTFTLL